MSNRQTDVKVYKLYCAGMFMEPCSREVTHIDSKGWVYCTKCGECRAKGVRCRKLKPAEKSRLASGLPLIKY
jgi:hypothetical protein